MKSLYLSLILFILMVISILLSINYLNNTCSEIKKISIKIESSLTNNNYAESKIFTDEFIKKWEASSKTLSLFIDHKEMDNINNDLYKLPKYIECENKEDALALTKSLIFFIDHINKMEKLHLENIF